MCNISPRASAWQQCREKTDSVPSSYLSGPAGYGSKRLTTLEYKQHWLVIHTPTYGGLKNIGIVQNVKNYTTTVSS